MKTITVLSGKGGVGKSSIAASIAVLFSEKKKIITADCDVDAPDFALALGLEEKDFEEWEDVQTAFRAEVIEEKCTGCRKCLDVCNFSAVNWNEEKNKPEINRFLCEGCGTCQLVCPENAIKLKPIKNAKMGRGKTEYGFTIVSGHLKMGESGSGDIVTEVKKEAKETGEKIEADLMLVDSAAGIGCPVIASIRGSDFVVAVTEPTPSALRDLQRALQVVEHFQIPYGLIINKWDLNPEFSEEIEEFAEDSDVPVLGKIPYSKDFVDSLVKMKPVVEFNPEWRERFEKIINKIPL